MAIVRKLITDQDLQQAMDKKIPIQVFENNHLIETGTTVLRFTSDTVITQKSVSDVSYHNRDHCQFFELKRK